MALSKASAPVEQPAGDLARSAILHSAAASSVEGMSALTVSTAARMATFGCANAEHVRQSIAFC